MSAIDSPSDRPAERRLLALGLRLFGASCLALMSVMVKLASERGIATPELMFWRQFLALPIVLGFIAMTSGLAPLKTERLGMHASRTLLGLTGMFFTFSSFILLPLPVATTIGFMVPVFATILAALVLREKTGIHRWGAVLLGFAGVLVVIQPGGASIPLAGATVGLTSALAIASMSILLRQMGRTEAATTTVFWFSALSSVLLAPLLFIFFKPHSAEEWLLLLGIGTIGGLGQLGFTASFRHAPVSVVVGMDYIALLWTSLAAWLLWDDLPPASMWIGAPLIIASGLYIAWREHRLSLKRTGELPL